MALTITVTNDNLDGVKAPLLFNGATNDELEGVKAPLLFNGVTNNELEVIKLFCCSMM
jgi:hypothetical protein